MVRHQPLPRKFYARNVLVVAKQSVGKLLLVQTKRGLVGGRIVETEAYAGPEDRAAHSYGGKRTKRTEIMYGDPGLVYMFLVYGLHWQFNLVTTARDDPKAVLIRAIEPVYGSERMQRRRKLSGECRELSNGPGKLCQALGLDGRYYGCDLTSGSLFLAEGDKPTTKRTPRVGVDYAGKWAKKPWRFYDPASAYVSHVPKQ